MQVAIALYPRFTALDVIGPFQVLVNIPGVEVVFVASEAGPVMDETGHCPLVASLSLAQVTAPDVVLIGGSGFDDDPTYDNPYGVADLRVVEWLRAVHPTATWSTSVCTGSTYLAAAGLLDGVDATIHWARREHLERLGARYTEERVVERGKVITAAGVSSGIDMALTLVGRMFGPELGQAIQLGIEYDPQPPFDTGSPAKAGPELTALVKSFMDAVIAAPA